MDLKARTRMVVWLVRCIWASHGPATRSRPGATAMAEMPIYHTHSRIRIDTPEQAVWWLSHWTNAHLIPEGAIARQPWRRTSPRELEAVAESLLKLRGQFDSRKFAKDGETVS